MITGGGYRKLGRAAQPMVAFSVPVAKGQGARSVVVGSRAVTPKTDSADRRNIVEPPVIDGISVFFDGDESLGGLGDLRQFNPLAIPGMKVILSLLP